MEYAVSEFVEDGAGFDEPAAVFVAAPACDQADRFARLQLIRSRRVGPATYRRMVAAHGSAAAALDVLPKVAEGAGLQGYEVCPEGIVRAEIKAAKRAGARLLCLGDAAYPPLLAAIPDAPPVLWAIGDQALMVAPVVAVIGTRNASSLGGRMARKLAEDLGAAGCVVVSGLARGIDAIAHEAALDTGTIAVQAGGVDVPYPPENAKLAEQIAAKGLRLSERPFGVQPQARDFPRRNRIVSGLAHVTVVVEAAARSGSMITARLALDQGREVMAVPGHPFDTRASGCNILLRDGAHLVRGAEDVLEVLAQCRPAKTGPGVQEQVELPLEPEPVARGCAEDLPERILSLLAAAPVPEDQLIRSVAGPPAQVAAALSALELSGQIARQAGGVLVRAPAA